MSTSLLKDVVVVSKFKKLANELTVTEFNQFLSKLTEKYGKEIVLKFLVSGIIKPTSIDNHHILLENMIEIVSDIIQCRESKVIQQTNALKVDQITSSLIGEIGSYLDQKSYSLFSCSNRTILVSLNQPNRLQMLCLKSIDNYSSINLQNYPQIKCLWFRLSQFNQFKLPQNQTICNELKTIVLWPNAPDITSNIEVSMEPFILNNCINLNNVRTLSIGSHEYWFRISIDTEFHQLLSRFSMIQHLQLAAIFFTTPPPHNFTELTFPTLNRLTLDSCAGSGASQWLLQLLQQHGPKLETLSLREHHDPNGSLNGLDNIQFSNLHKLATFGVRSSTMNSILKTAKSIKQVCFETTNTPKMSDEEIQTIIQKMIKEQIGLQCIHIRTRHNKLGYICNALESALFSIRNKARDVFEIGIQFVDKKVINAEDVVLYISRIVTRLSTSNIRKFTLFCRWNNCNNADLELLLNTVQDLFDSTSSIKCIEILKCGFICQNEQYEMIGHHNWWRESLQYIRH